MNYSIIIPTKNIPALLKRCIDSIPQRSDVEVIIVDDCSTPDCIEIEHEIVSHRNNCYLYLNQESRGAGYCRNIGINHSIGKWLLFADSDDFYTNSISSILEKYKDDDRTDIVYLNAQKYFSDGKVAPLAISRYIDNFYQKRIYSEKVLCYGIWSPWTRMVKRALVISNKLKYDEIPTGNDMYFCLNCSYFARTKQVENQICYNYYLPMQGSITQSYYRNIDNAKNKIDLKCKVIDFHKKTGYIFKPCLYYDLIKMDHVTNRREYRKAYYEYLRTKNVNLMTDFFHFIIEKIAKLLGIL